MDKLRKNSNALREACGQSRWLGREVKDQVRWNRAPIWGWEFSKGCGMEKESVRL